MQEISSAVRSGHVGRIQRGTVLPQTAAGFPGHEDDRLELSAGVNPDAGASAAETAAFRLRSLFPGINMTFAFLQENDIASYAAAAGSGLHLTLSESFLEAMGRDEESFQAGVLLIHDALGQLAGKVGQKLSEGRPVIGAGIVINENGVSTWTSSPPKDERVEELKRMIEQLEESRKRMLEKMRKQQKKTIDANPRELMTRLVRAEVQQSARDVLIATNHKIFTLRIAAAAGDQYDQNKVRAALSNLQRVANRARAKIRRLDEEQTIRSREKRAQHERELKKMRELRAELYKRKSKRRNREYAQLFESYGPRNLRKDRDEEEELRHELIALETSVSSPSADAAPAGDMGGGVEVSVSTIEVTGISAGY